MDLQALARRLDRCLPEPHTPPGPPTPRSVAAIETHFGLPLPRALIVLAQEARHFSAYFAGLGEDQGSPTHIIRINSAWRRRRRTKRIPRDLVVINLGFDEDLDCLTRPGGDDGVVVYWCPHGERVEVGSGFCEYLTQRITAWEGR